MATASSPQAMISGEPEDRFRKSRQTNFKRRLRFVLPLGCERTGPAEARSEPNAIRDCPVCPLFRKIEKGAEVICVSGAVAMARRKKKPTAKLTILVSPPIATARTWAAFSDRHADWLREVGVSMPLYSLPEESMHALTRADRGSWPVLDSSSADVELALTDLCRQSHAIGFWNGQPIRYALFCPPPPLPSRELLAGLAWDPGQFLRARSVTEQTPSVVERLKGYVGWLLTEPAFLTAVEALATHWQALPERQRPGFPLKRSIPVVEAPEGAGSAEASTVKFIADFETFCDRWGLMGMATWDLPDPEGPFLPSRLPSGTPAMPTHGVHLILPLHYPLFGDDALLTQILEQQRYQAQEKGLDPSIAGLAHHKAYAQIAQVIHLERTVVARYGQGSRPKGFVFQLEQAIADVLGVGRDQVKKLRKAISSCRRGMRAGVKWLRPPIR